MKKLLSVLLPFCLLCVLTAGCSGNPRIRNTGDVDVDLTALSSTMVYAEVFNMTEAPSRYLGKTIKASGIYNVFYYDKTDSYYHYVIIEDAAACCAQGLEFILSGASAYPDAYPEDQAKIEIIGVFGSYEEAGETYYYLEADEIKIL